MGIQFASASTQHITLLASKLNILNNKAAATISLILLPITPLPTGTDSKRIVSLASGAGAGFTRFAIAIGPDGYLQCIGKTLDANTASVWTTALNPLTVNTRYFVAIIMDCVARVFKIYINGVLIDTSPVQAGWTSGNFDNTNCAAGEIGTRAAADTLWLDADIMDLRIYNRALTSIEIESISTSNGTDSIFNGLVLNYLFTQNSAGQSYNTTIFDRTNSEITGTPFNNPIASESYTNWRKRQN